MMRPRSDQEENDDHREGHGPWPKWRIFFLDRVRSAAMNTGFLVGREDPAADLAVLRRDLRRRHLDTFDGKTGVSRRS